VAVVVLLALIVMVMQITVALVAVDKEENRVEEQ
jgi:hypothetical protein